MSNQKKDTSFYDECAEELKSIEDSEFEFMQQEFHVIYDMVSCEYKIPYITRSQIPLDSRIMTIEPSENIEAPYVITISNMLDVGGDKIVVPLNTTKHFIHKINTRKMAGMVSISMDIQKCLKVDWSYKNCISQPKTSKIIGVDTGISDAFHTSEDKAIGSMGPVIDFYKKAKEVGIKPILGCEIYVAPGSRFDREQARGEDRYYHLVLLAENNQGYKNLMKIVTRGFTEGYYYKPRVDYEVLEKYHEGIIALSACLAGEIPSRILKEDFDGARAAARKMRDIFGENNFFLELQDHGIREQTQVNTSLIRLSKELGIPMVVTNDVHYIREEDAIPHDLLLCIQTGKKVSDKDRMRYEGGQYYLKSEEEMQKVFPLSLIHI